MGTTNPPKAPGEYKPEDLQNKVEDEPDPLPPSVAGAVSAGDVDDEADKAKPPDVVKQSDQEAPRFAGHEIKFGDVFRFDADSTFITIVDCDKDANVCSVVQLRIQENVLKTPLIKLMQGATLMTYAVANHHVNEKKHWTYQYNLAAAWKKM
jgi:hypothetical protein